MQYCMDLNLLTPALLQKCNLNIQKASRYILYGHVLSSIMEFPSGVGSMMSMSVTFFEIFCKVVDLSQPIKLSTKSFKFTISSLFLPCIIVGHIFGFWYS